MRGYLVEWADAAGRADVALTLFCPTLPQAYRLANHPPPRWYYWGKRPSIRAVDPPSPGTDAARPPIAPEAATLWAIEEGIGRAYGVRITPQLNGRYTVASRRGNCPPLANRTIYQVAAAIRTIVAADAARVDTAR